MGIGIWSHTACDNCGHLDFVACFYLKGDETEEVDLCSLCLTEGLEVIEQYRKEEKNRE